MTSWKKPSTRSNRAPSYPTGTVNWRGRRCCESLTASTRRIGTSTPETKRPGRLFGWGQVRRFVLGHVRIGGKRQRASALPFRPPSEFSTHINLLRRSRFELTKRGKSGGVRGQARAATSSPPHHTA